MAPEKTKINWWHLVIAGWGIAAFLGRSNFLILLLGDSLFFIGVAWGAIILSRRLFQKFKARTFLTKLRQLSLKRK